MDIDASPPPRRRTRRAMAPAVENLSPTTPWEKPTDIRAKAVRDGRDIAFQLAEVTIA